MKSGEKEMTDNLIIDLQRDNRYACVCEDNCFSNLHPQKNILRFWCSYLRNALDKEVE